MRVLMLERFGSLSAVHVVDRPQPVPGPDEVRVRVHAATYPGDMN